MYMPSPMLRQANWGGKTAKVVASYLHEDRLGWVTVECEGVQLELDEREVINIE